MCVCPLICAATPNYDEPIGISSNSFSTPQQLTFVLKAKSIMQYVLPQTYLCDYIWRRIPRMSQLERVASSDAVTARLAQRRLPASSDPNKTVISFVGPDADLAAESTALSFEHWQRPHRAAWGCTSSPGTATPSQSRPSRIRGSARTAAR
ncbi:hypothetical protein EJB05_50651 [Eragrostis curvula]|uniref:Uncharacterized protein n=1 Tax=Eragrostis curvula TaxID=38414 RepID=A0A5J9SXT7_9POAL|nr:hypothetical protein EJB05_50651 [Eragrostis curvula]